jgi:hypothetical protein
MTWMIESDIQIDLVRQDQAQSVMTMIIVSGTVVDGPKPPQKQFIDLMVRHFKSEALVRPALDALTAFPGDSIYVNGVFHDQVRAEDLQKVAAPRTVDFDHYPSVEVH